MSDVKILHPDVQYAVRKAEKTFFFFIAQGQWTNESVASCRNPIESYIPEEVDILKGKILGQNGGFLVKMGIFPK